MPEAQKEFRNAVEQALEAVMFESWLRFYFIEELPPEPAKAGDGPGKAPVDEERLAIRVPEKGMARIAELYPNLLPLAEGMNGHEVDFETSRRAVCTFVLGHLDGKTMPRDMAAVVFASSTFQVELQLFHTWLQLHEAQLDEGFQEFGAWRNLFAQWRATPGARELAEKLAVATQGRAGCG
ncbi:hypothetical protein, partial [Desulfovibrio sp.]|uniref:hypothetical protein n=1 Tax=Desulfovibrio sp. TaxID=885 RepID=UPI0023C605D1